jgi:hypothetical protein
MWLLAAAAMLVLFGLAPVVWLLTKGAEMDAIQERLERYTRR